MNQKPVYVELHARSAFSFLEGASLPEELAETAATLGYPAMALLDLNGVYGAPRFHQAAARLGVRPLVGAEVTLAGGARLPLLVETREGYQNLCRLITNMKLRAPKGAGETAFDELAEHAKGLICLTGGADGPLVPELARETGAVGDPATRRLPALDRLVSTFGRANVYVELQRHLRREEERRTQALVGLARAAGLPIVATNEPRHSLRAGRALLDVLTCVRAKRTLDSAGRLLAPNAERHLKPAREMARLFADLPEALANTVELANQLTFTLADLGYRFPDYPVPPGETMMSYLTQLTEAGARERYRPYHERARRQIARELALIAKLDLAGYFLIVWDIVQFCRRHDILVQGRGSAANSAVCYSLGITAVDPVGMDLLFERFLSEERGEWPDIDLDLPSGDRRERVIQHVYDVYGARGAAMTANIITYRGRSAAREVGKAFGFPPDMLDRLSKLVSTFEFVDPNDRLAGRLATAGFDLAHPRVARFADLWHRIQDLPRHLGQHSGGMVICQGRLDTVVPLENATMPGRVVVQWDKDDCADMGIIKVDLLGLGMMSAIQDALAMARARGHTIDLAHLPPDDPVVYTALQKADTVGVFQVESRAQMATLPRLKPERFYDLVVQVAIIRPGPIVGQMVHPYLNRRAGRDPVTYPHPSLEPILARTLGVPLFQEQLLRIAMVAAGFTGGQSEELRRAFSFKRSERRMREIEIKLREGMAWNGITGAAADSIVRSITSFALYGFPESHAASFALLAYASAYLKVHYPAEFYAALLNNQPMGFYHPATIVKDAQRHGQRIRPIDVRRSDWPCTIEDDGAVRLGLRYVTGLREETGRRIEQERRARPFASLDELRARTGLRRDELATLAEIGTLNGLGMRRREALWQIERVARPAGELFEQIADEEEEDTGARSPLRNMTAPERGAGDPALNDAAQRARSPLRDMTATERLAADYHGTSVTVGPHPLAFCRPQLDALKTRRAADLMRIPDGTRVRVAGSVIVRQRPGTAKGFVFLSLEDETGILNIIVRPDLFERERLVVVSEPFLVVEGVLQNLDGVASIKAQRLRPLSAALAAAPSHDFY